MEDLQKIKEFFSKPLDEVQEKYYVEPSKKGFSVLRNDTYLAICLTTLKNTFLAI